MNEQLKPYISGTQIASPDGKTETMVASLGFHITRCEDGKLRAYVTLSDDGKEGSLGIKEGAPNEPTTVLGTCDTREEINTRLGKTIMGAGATLMGALIVEPTKTDAGGLLTALVEALKKGGVEQPAGRVH